MSLSIRKSPFLHNDLKNKTLPAHFCLIAAKIKSLKAIELDLVEHTKDRFSHNKAYTLLQELNLSWMAFSGEII